MVASRESQYKIFHFHHGGLDKLSEVFQQWKFCTETHLRDQVAQVTAGWDMVGYSKGMEAPLSGCQPRGSGTVPSHLFGGSGSGDSPLRSMAFGFLCSSN